MKFSQQDRIDFWGTEGSQYDWSRSLWEVEQKTGSTSPPAMLCCFYMRQFRGFQGIIYCRSVCVCLLMVHNPELTQEHGGHKPWTSGAKAHINTLSCYQGQKFCFVLFSKRSTSCILNPMTQTHPWLLLYTIPGLMSVRQQEHFHVQGGWRRIGSGAQGEGVCSSP